MDKQDIKDLMQQFDQSSLTKFKFKKTDFELLFTKELNLSLSQADSLRIMQPTSQSDVGTVDVEQTKRNNLVEVRAPMVGTFMLHLKKEENLMLK